MNYRDMTISRFLNHGLMSLNAGLLIDGNRTFGIANPYEDKLKVLREKLNLSGYNEEVVSEYPILNADQLKLAKGISFEIRNLEIDAHQRMLFECGKQSAGYTLTVMQDKIGFRSQRDKIIGYEIFLEEINDNVWDSPTEGFVSAVKNSLNNERESYYNRRMEEMRRLAT